MALELKLTDQNIYTDGVTLDVADASTGWGDSIAGGGTYPLRAEVGLHLFGWEMNFKSVRDLALTISNINAATNNIWSLTFSRDCWFQIDMLAVLLWVAGTYTAGRVVSHNGTIYLATDTTTAEPGTVGAPWSEVIDHETLLDTDEETVLDAYSSDVFFGRYNSVFSTNFVLATDSEIDMLDLFDKDREQDDDILRIAKKLIFHTAVQWNSARGDHYKADLILKRANDL
jgi:hypothetical protein